MERMTRKRARSILSGMNQTLQAAGHDCYLRMQGRNGYTGLDLFDNVTNSCLRNIRCGTPRQCLESAEQYTAAHSEESKPAPTMQRWPGSLA